MDGLRALLQFLLSSIQIGRMILESQVKSITEKFIRSALKDYPNTVEVLLDHPSIGEWYKRVAAELSIQEAAAFAQGQPFSGTNEVMSWAAGYVRHVLEKAEASTVSAGSDQRSPTP